MLTLCVLLQIINKVKVTRQVHIKAKVDISTSFQFHVGHTVQQAGGLHSTEMYSCILNITKSTHRRTVLNMM